MKNSAFDPDHPQSAIHFQADGIKGLVLAGGSATRMEQDKGDLVYYTQPQKYHVATLLTDLGLDTYISLRKEQEKSKKFRYIVDRYENIGPMAGLLSAFEKCHTAWLVAACDYPLLKTKHLKQLFLQRDRSKTATVFLDETSGFFLPTVAIYETGFFPLLQESLARKDYSFQKLLKENPIHIIKTQDRAFQSIDTPAAYTALKKEIHENPFCNC